MGHGQFQKCIVQIVTRSGLLIQHVLNNDKEAVVFLYSSFLHLICEILNNILRGFVQEHGMENYKILCCIIEIYCEGI